MKKSKLLCLHGFLGSPKDFDFLKDKYDIFAPSLSHLVDKSVDEIISILENEIDFKECSILGYSFGSRLGLQILAKRDEFKFFIGLAGHMGLSSEAERAERLMFEDLMIQKLANLSEADFIAEWDQYDIFKSDKKSYNPNFENSQLFFKNYGLSKQPYLQERLIKLRSKILMCYGDLDTKYKNYALENLLDYNINILPDVGHRILNHYKIVQNICKENI